MVVEMEVTKLFGHTSTLSINFPIEMITQQVTNCSFREEKTPTENRKLDKRFTSIGSVSAYIWEFIFHLFYSDTNMLSRAFLIFQKA